jgi:hypothetical protein
MRQQARHGSMLTASRADPTAALARALCTYSPAIAVRFAVHASAEPAASKPGKVEICWRQAVSRLCSEAKSAPCSHVR